MLTPNEYNFTATEEDALYVALRSSHDMRTTISILDHNEAPLKTIRPQMISGAVQIDSTADVSRSCSLELLDPFHSLHFDSGNAAEGALYADNFVRVESGIYVDSLDKWADIPVFTGLLSSFKRDGPVVSIEAQGKETLALDPHFTIRHYTISKGTTVSNAIKKVLGEIGEQRFSLGMIEGRLSKARSVSPGEQPWQVIVGGGEDSGGGKKPSLMSRAKGNFYLFYDGRGRLTAKRKNANSQFTFRHDRHVLAYPVYEYDTLEFRNHAEVRGGMTKGKNPHRAKGEFSLPGAHPLSPLSLSRNGKPRFLTIFHEAEGLKTDSACREKARKLVEAAAYEGIAASFDCLPVPMLEENDTVTLDMGSFSMSFKLKQFTIPLTSDSPMSLGYNKKKKNFKKNRRRSF